MTAVLAGGAACAVTLWALGVSRGSPDFLAGGRHDGARDPAAAYKPAPPSGARVAFANRSVRLDSPELTFLVVGDWGRQGTYQDRQVGDAMGVVAQQAGAAFVFSVGDNVYESGLTDESDPWFDETFTKVYTHPGLATLPWYTMMGNHEYYGNSSGELAASLTAKDGRWHPFRSNVQSFRARDGSLLLTLASVDTSPFLKKYRKEDTDWRGLTPVVLPGDKPVPGEGVDPAPLQADPPRGSVASRLASSARSLLRKFPVPTREAWTAWETAQLAQLDGWLVEAQRSHSAWTFVSGHHPLTSWSGKSYAPSDLAGLDALVNKHRVPVYFNGHNHNLYWGKTDKPTNYICSGAGSLVDPDVVDPADGSLLFGDNAAGFVVVTLDTQQAVLTFVDASGAVLFEKAIQRDPFRR